MTDTTTTNKPPGIPPPNNLPPANPATEIPEPYNTQFDYAWKWFDFHAKQRTTMFNFYIILIAATLGTVAALVKTNVESEILYLCWFGVIVSILFYGLDCRNVRLLRYGELNLLKLEQTKIFADDKITPPPTVFYEKANRVSEYLSRNTQTDRDITANQLL